MKLEIWFRDKFRADVTAEGDSLHVSGPGADAVKHVISYYESPELKGDALLQFLARRLRGHWHAVEVE